jgi:hypothetical protein
LVQQVDTAEEPLRYANICRYTRFKVLSAMTLNNVVLLDIRTDFVPDMEHVCYKAQSVNAM